MVWQGEGGREGEWWEVRIGFVSPWKSGVASSPVGLKTPTPHSLLGPQDFGPEATGVLSAGFLSPPPLALSVLEIGTQPRNSVCT